MPIALSSSKTSYGYLEAGTISLSGGAPATQYTVKLVNPNGHTSNVTVTTDGSGNASFGVVAQTRGAFTAEVRPTAEHYGLTTPAATLSFKGQ